MISTYRMQVVLTIPNLITLSRVILMPVYLAIHALGLDWLALAVLAYLLLSDLLDGWAARRLNQQTALGAILDPISDRIVTLGLFGYGFMVGGVGYWLWAIVFLRNFAQLMSVPILMLWLKKRFYVKPKALPRWANVFSGVFIVLDLHRSVLALVAPTPAIPWVLASIGTSVALLEATIAWTFIPRFIAIARGRHDTFE